MDLSVIIVSFNARSDLAECLAALHAAPPGATAEIVVVDNASTDGSADAARQWPTVRVIEQDVNQGFAAANNVGIRASSGEAILLLNGDTVMPPGAIDRLLEVLRRHPEAAVVGPRLVDTQGHPELSFGQMMSPWSELRQKRLMKGLRRQDPTTLRRVNLLTRHPRWPDWVSGACLLVWRADAESVGLLDERFFIYTEDIDFCAAIRARGRRVLFTPTVEVVHKRGRSVAAAPAATQEAYRRSHLAFYQKHHPLLAPLLRLYVRLSGE